MSYFKADNLYKKWGELEVRFSCGLEKGQMLGIVGQSGCGKSTVLRLIAGLLSQKTSTHEPAPHIVLDGLNISNVVPGKRNIGMVFQNAALFAHMRVEDNVSYGLRSRGMAKKESREQASAFLEKFGLAGFGRRWPDSLSGGEAQRVSLARTLIVQPALVLFDEPFSSLDAPLRKKLATDILTLQQDIGFAGIMVTHDIQEAQTICDIVTVMKNGLQVWTGKAEDFRETLL